MPKARIRQVFSFLVGLAVLIACLNYILRGFQWREIISLLASTDLMWLLGIGGLSIFIYWIVRALRWFLILRCLGTSTPSQ